MIIWGSGGHDIDLGQVETTRCSICEKDRPFKLHLQYRYAHLYYIFSWITEKKYLLLCDVCSRGWKLNTKEVEATFKKHPIPFMKRFGWLFLVGPLFAILLIGILGPIFSP